MRENYNRYSRKTKHHSRKYHCGRIVFQNAVVNLTAAKNLSPIIDLIVVRIFNVYHIGRILMYYVCSTCIYNIIYCLPLFMSLNTRLNFEQF